MSGPRPPARLLGLVPLALALPFALAPAAAAQNWFDAPRIVAHPVERLVAVGDFAGGPAEDLVGLDPASSFFRVHRNDGTGHFLAQPPALMQASGTFNGSLTATGDFDGDGNLDLVFAVDNQLNFQLGDGAGGFAGKVLGLASNPADVAVGDFDGDGRDDAAVLVGALPSAAFWIHHDGIQFRQSASVSGPNGFSSAVATDVDGDGVVDLLAQAVAPTGAATRPFVVYRGTGAGPTFEDGRAYLGRGLGYRYVDLDQDGDTDVAAIDVHLGRAFRSPENGRIRQYGAGVPGTGGAVPVLGATGPLRVGAPIPELRLRDAVGGTQGVLAVGFGEAELPGVPAGVTSYVDQPVYVVLPVPGAAGVAAEGAWTIPLAVPASLVGVSLFLQVFPIDAAAPFGLSATNGLEVRLGT